MPLRSAAEISLMQEAGRVVFEVLEALERAAAPGVSTWELDQLAEELTFRRRAKPAFKGYLGFPSSICASVNDEVVHGIPSKRRVLKEGDLLKLDFGVCFRGYFGDAARTVSIGNCGVVARNLIKATRESLERAIEKLVPGNRLGDIGYAVQSHVEARGFSVVRDFVGHGIGQSLHEEPSVPNFGRPGTGALLEAGMVLAVEPMVNAGSHKVAVLDDDWTAVTQDGSLSAHFEHTIWVTESGPCILTGP